MAKLLHIFKIDCSICSLALFVNVKPIVMDYCTKPLMRKMDNASCLTQRMMKFNVSVSGAIESILVQNLTMRGKEICNTLNNRMKIWRKQLDDDISKM